MEAFTEMGKNGRNISLRRITKACFHPVNFKIPIRHWRGDQVVSWGFGVSGRGQD